MLNTMEYLTSKYEIGEAIGAGAFSQVKVATERATGNKYAIKIIDRLLCLGKEYMIETEVNILLRVRHENIVQLYEMYEIGDKIYLVMELVTGGELFEDIVARAKYSEAEASRTLKKILLAIDYLHSQGIVHRDLKPENLLLSDRSNHPRVMISDFGLSKIYNDTEVMRTSCGTPGYVAPEILRRQGYGKEVDLWSLGIIAYILLCGYPPFYNENNLELFKLIMQGRFEFESPFWDNISDMAKDFIRKLLVLNPQSRLTASAALRHPFITSYFDHVQSQQIERNLPLPTYSVPAGQAISAQERTNRQIQKNQRVNAAYANATTHKKFHAPKALFQFPQYNLKNDQQEQLRNSIATTPRTLNNEDIHQTSYSHDNVSVRFDTYDSNVTDSGYVETNKQGKLAGRNNQGNKWGWKRWGWN